eukprot:6214331-Pleurochrysis_carterae.AAC.4
MIYVLGPGESIDERVCWHIWTRLAHSVYELSSSGDDAAASVSQLRDLRVVVSDSDISSTEVSKPIHRVESKCDDRRIGRPLRSLLQLPDQETVTELVGRCMLSHSFGPMRTGVTFVVHARFRSADIPEYDPEYEPDYTRYILKHRQIASRALKEALAPYHHKDLDTFLEFGKQPSSCERIAKAVWARLVAGLPKGDQRDWKR